MTQARAAARLGLTQPRLNALLKGRIAQFSLDASVNAATRAGLRVDLLVTAPKTRISERATANAWISAGKIRLACRRSPDQPREGRRCPWAPLRQLGRRRSEQEHDHGAEQRGRDQWRLRRRGHQSHRPGKGARAAVRAAVHFFSW